MSISKHALEEILYNISKKDLIKASLVLDHFDHISVKEQQRILFELNKCDDDFAIPLMVSLWSKGGQAVEQFATLEETILSKAMNSPQVIIKYLTEDSPKLPSYVKLAGALRLQEATPLLIKILAATTDQRTMRETLKALGEIGNPDATNAVSEFLYVDIDDLMFTAIQALGHIGTPPAMQRLAEFFGKSEETDIFILDIFAELQNEVALQKLNETLLSHSAALRNYSKGKLVTIGTKAIPLLSDNLFKNSPDLQILSLNILGETGDASAAAPVRKLLNTQPKDANIRFAAYETLATLPVRKGDYVLAGGLTDSDEGVRLAATKAINNNLDDVLMAGIRNMVGRQDNEARMICRVIMDAQAQNIFQGLIEEPFFRETATDYLGGAAPDDTKNYFLQTLEESGHQKITEAILHRAQETAEPKTAKIRIAAVDDSRMILSVYRTVLNQLGYEPILFQNPEEALVWLASDKPRLLCTDLNMPEMTGIELIEKIRQRYSKEELPVVLVTTQGDGNFKRSATQAGANAILAKPFDAEKLGSAVDELLT